MMKQQNLLDLTPASRAKLLAEVLKNNAQIVETPDNILFNCNKDVLHSLTQNAKKMA